MDTGNIEGAHEQLFFEDSSGGNVGYFAERGLSLDNGVVIADPTNPLNPKLSGSRYAITDPGYDDALMRQALRNIRPAWQNTRYDLIGNNCQDFADALREEYDRLKLLKIR